MWRAPHKEEQRSPQPGSARGYPSHENHQGAKIPADTRRFGCDGALGTLCRALMQAHPPTSIFFDASAEPLAREMACRLPEAFALVSGTVPDRDWYLFVDNGGLMLRKGRRGSFRLSDAASDRRRRSRNSALARACSAGRGLRVLDATAGWGTDGFALAGLGCHVRMLETHPQVFAMLDDRLRRSGMRASTEWTDARERMRGADAERYDIVYLDPMFPPRNKTALPARPLQVLREIVGGEAPDVAELLALARGCARSRVVMKQRAHGPQVGDPDWRVTGRTVRFDVYRPV